MSQRETDSFERLPGFSSICAVMNRRSTIYVLLLPVFYYFFIFITYAGNLEGW